MDSDLSRQERGSAAPMDVKRLIVQGEHELTQGLPQLLRKGLSSSYWSQESTLTSPREERADDVEGRGGWVIRAEKGGEESL